MMVKRPHSKLRIPAIDLARGIALFAMAIFHFGWDLENFGLVQKGMTLEPQWKYFARAIASSFLILVGIGAWLAHNTEFNRKTFLKRIVMVGGAASIITFATYFATPNGFIFFGILHNIAMSSVLILLFISLPVSVLAPIALFTLTAHLWARTSLLDHPIWWWSGLSQVTPKANDYVPIFPWFGWVLLGLIIAKLFDHKNYWDTISSLKCSSATNSMLRFFGRHSLLFYLLHQPIMIGLLYAFVKLSAGT